MATPGTAIDVDVDVHGSLPAAVEVACYRIAAEALANAIRHAGATSGRRAPRGTATCLSLQVEDDGVGLSGRPRVNGLGLASMRQRAEEIGGRAGGHEQRVGNRGSRRSADGAPMTRILLVDDHPLFLDGVRAALTGADDLEVVGEAHDGAPASRSRPSSAPTWCSWTSTSRTSRESTRPAASWPRRQTSGC